LWEFHEALLEAATFEDLPGKWQAAILEAEQNRPKLRAPLMARAMAFCTPLSAKAPRKPGMG
jgi:hypothetical protein